MSKILTGRSSCIRKISSNRAEQKGFYRFLNNEKVSEQALIEGITTKTRQLVSGRHVLCIQDTSEINLNRHKGRIKPNTGIGLIGNNQDVGFFLHPSLVIDAGSLNALGFSHVHLWHRDVNKGTKFTRNYKQLPIEEKESYKWIDSSQRSKEILKEAEKITIIQDREGDIYEQFIQVPDERTELLIRSRTDRKLTNGKTLFGHLDELKPQGSYYITVEGDKRKLKEKREVEIEIKYSKVSLAKPKNLTRSDISEEKTLYVVEAKEKDCQGKPILWRILTTHKVEDIETAKLIIIWYSLRWLIEQVFRLLKRKGFRIEDSEIETGWAIRKLTIMILQTVLKVIQMQLAYDQEEGQPIDEVFTKNEQTCLQLLNKQLQGKTRKLKNTYNRQTLSWATWIIARLGGWKGYKSQRSPGPITLKNGLDKFYLIFEGWKLAKSQLQDVGTR